MGQKVLGVVQEVAVWRTATAVADSTGHVGWDSGIATARYAAAERGIVAKPVGELVRGDKEQRSQGSLIRRTLEKGRRWGSEGVDSTD